MSPVGRKSRARQHPFGWKPLQPSLERSECQTQKDSEQPSVSKTSSRSSSSVQKIEISQQQTGGGVVSTQIGHTPVWLEAQGQTAVQCRQNKISQQQKNSSRAILTQIRHEPGRLEAQG